MIERKTVAGLSVLLLTTLLSAPVEAAPAASDTAAPQVRQRWQDFIKDPKKVASLQAAVTKMKSLDTAPPESVDFRRSWAYWANIHGYYGTQSPDGTVQQQIDYLTQNGLSQYVPYYKGIVDQTPPDSIATTTWATCQHGGPPGSFMGWHRMYLYYFEQVLRWAANDNTLRLPYWDYTDPSQLALPAPYQNTTAVFYDARRNPPINTGAATLSSLRTNINNALTISDFFTYEVRIENGVHGYVHCTVGPTCPVAHMGDVPVAGNDPIFYSHHANIDRMWACWQNLYPTPGGSWQDQTFSFPDATGTLQTRPIKDFFDSAKNGYVYDNYTNCSRPAAGTPTLAGGPAQQGKKATMLGSKQGVAISAPLTQVDMAVSKPTMKSTMAALAPTERIDLVLRDVTAQSPPGVIFDVFLAKKGDPKSRQQVGTLSFFGAFNHRHGAADDDKGHGKGMAAKTFEFDATAAVKALGESDLIVEIEAAMGHTMADAAKNEENKKQAAAAFRSAAGLKIGAIELKATGTGPAS